MEKKEIVIQNIHIKYMDEGKTSDPCVLMIHGFPESSLIWQDVISTVSRKGFRAIAPDLPGFGQSERFQEPAVWERYVEFISDFLEALQINKVHLFVHDWGGLIGLRWGMEQLHRVSSILVSNSTISPDYSWHELAKNFQTDEVGERVLRAMSHPKVWKKRFGSLLPNADERIMNDFYRVFSSEEDHQTALQLYRSGDTEKLRAYSGKLLNFSGPVTIVWGEKDPYISVQHAIKLRDEHIPHAKVHVIPNAGHFIQLEIPVQVQQLVDQHLDRVLQTDG
ncbi:alpha/beta fold hydrolase [Ammoniphilus sp. 3BR4]|uniref:alpha/beta fold hydrolase n=1 Tax=Ammoniphilus sp. 3BR4 TaxID=3158265 RepID=UPI003467AB8D